jgi:hypothetical protein
MLEVELEIKDLKDLHMLLSMDSNLTGCCTPFIPKRYKEQDAYEIAIDRLEEQLHKETMKPYTNSGHAFVLFDSVSSLNAVLKHYQNK